MKVVHIKVKTTTLFLQTPSEQVIRINFHYFGQGEIDNIKLFQVFI